MILACVVVGMTATSGSELELRSSKLSSSKLTDSKLSSSKLASSKNNHANILERLRLRGGGSTLSVAYGNYSSQFSHSLTQWWFNSSSATSMNLGEIEKYFMLAGDVGGTNARLAIYSVTPDNLTAGCVSSEVYGRKYKVRHFGSLAAVIGQFLKDAEKDQAISLREYLQIKSRRYPTTACIAVAGHVTNNQVKFTNVRKWPLIRGTDLERQLGIQKVQLINDFCALSEGVVAMEAIGLCDCQSVQKTPLLNSRKRRKARPPMLVIGAGTGLGECLMVWNGKNYHAMPSEGGHVDFSPRNKVQAEILEFMRKKYNCSQGGSPHVSVERLCSGQGIQDIYEFLRKKYPSEIDIEADTEFENAIEKAVVVTNFGQRDRRSLMNRAVEMFLSIYAAEIGNAALKFLPFGGIYIGGGIAPNLKDYIEKYPGTFLTAVRDKGRMSHLVREMPIKLILSDGMAIRGAETVARRKLLKFLDDRDSL